jgi:hypothetical protein
MLAAARDELSGMLVLRRKRGSARRRCLAGAGQAGGMEGLARPARAELLATGERARRRSMQTEHVLIPRSGLPEWPGTTSAFA